MAGGISALRKIQIGKESMAGTKVAATDKLIGKLTMEKEVKLHRPEDERGSLAPNHRTMVTGEAVNLSYEGDLTFEQVMYLLSMAVDDRVAGDVDGSGYKWEYEPNLTTPNTIKTYTFEYGDNVQEYEAEYVGCSELEISGALDEPLKVKATLFGRNQEASTFTGSISDPLSLTPALTNKTKLYIDDIDDQVTYPIGTTPKSSILTSFTWKLVTGFTPRKHGGAELYFDSLAEKPKKVSLELTFDFNSDAHTEWTKYVAGDRRLLRLETTHDSLNKLELDMAGVYTKFSSLEDSDGADTVKVSLESEYDSEWGKLFAVTVYNEVDLI